jgi:hypothetical protein
MPEGKRAARKARYLLEAIPLLRRFELDPTQKSHLLNLVETMADEFRADWPVKEDMFFYWHMARYELRNALDAIATVGLQMGMPNLSVGAFGCQGVESFGSLVFKAMHSHSNWKLDGKNNYFVQALTDVELTQLVRESLLEVNAVPREPVDACAVLFGPETLRRLPAISQKGRILRPKTVASKVTGSGPGADGNAGQAKLSESQKNIPKPKSSKRKS